MNDKIMSILNEQSKKFIELSNKSKNEFFHISSISFSKEIHDMYLGDIPVKTELLKITIKRINKKNKNHLLINIKDRNSIDRLFDWNLTQDVSNEINNIILKCIN